MNQDIKNLQEAVRELADAVEWGNIDRVSLRINTILSQEAPYVYNQHQNG